MFSYRNDLDTDGAGVAFCDALGPDRRRLDLGSDGSGQRSSDWAVVEAELGVPVLICSQVHGARVLTVDHQDDPATIAAESADALVTTAAGLAVAVRVADCLPVLFADPAAGVVAAAHAGRVGLAAGVLSATLERMAELGAAEVTAWIGPHICGQCYEVPAQLQHEFGNDHPAAPARTSWGTPSLDLAAAAQRQLQEQGCRVIRADPCTRTTPSLHSYRRDGAAAGRQAGLVWLP